MDRTSRTKALWSGAATVAVLAVVLIVFGLVGPLRSKQPAGEAPLAVEQPATTSQMLYQQAVQAEASGETTKAAELAQAALAADPGNAAARTLLDKIAQGPTDPAPNPDEPDASIDETPAVDPDAAFRKKYENLAALLPTNAAGFSYDIPLQFGPDITMSGNQVPASKTITLISWAAHDLKTAAAAKSFITKTSKQSFPEDGASVTVNGKKAYFGTDGTRFATVAFARGRYAFEVLVTVSGADPVTAKAIASEAARVFPATPAR